MQFLGVPFFFAMGVLQSWFVAGFLYNLGWTGLFADLTAIVWGCLPFVGSIGGMLGAMYAWDWNKWLAGIVFIVISGGVSVAVCFLGPIILSALTIGTILGVTALFYIVL